MWDHSNTGDFAPTYYLQTDAPLYYYSFTDAAIAMGFLALKPAEQARLDPMITGFNPNDMYAVDHIRRVLLTFPTVFSGIGEFSVHKEFVSSKVAGGAASLTNPALDRIFDFAAEAGLVTLIHNDIGLPFPKPDQPPYLLDQLMALFRRHPGTTIIWAHSGLGRIVRPAADQLRIIDEALSDSGLTNLYVDISWSEVAKYLTASPGTVQAVAEVIKKHPTRFLFGSDEVAPSTPEEMTRVFVSYEPLWAALGPETSRMVRIGNYQRLFDAARTKVRAWEHAHAGEAP
jgi:predicted TIM-barrel fold metal-dependent hydrolase